MFPDSPYRELESPADCKVGRSLVQFAEISYTNCVKIQFFIKKNK